MVLLGLIFFAHLLSLGGTTNQTNGYGYGQGRPVIFSVLRQWMLSSSIRAEITKYHRLGGLYTASLLLSLKGRLVVKDENARWLGEGPLLGHSFLVVLSRGGMDEGAPP